MAEEVDFNKFNSAEEALDAWLQPSLSLKIGINMPSAANPSTPPPPAPPSPPPPPPSPPPPILLLDQDPQLSSQSIEESTISQPPICESTEGSATSQHTIVNNQPHPPSHDDQDVADHRRYSQAGRSRRNPRQGPAEGPEDEIIVPAFPWATDRRARVHTLDHLIASGLTSIVGEVQCRRCERRESVAMDLLPKFREVESFVRPRMGTMHERAADEWMNPVFGRCEGCNQPNSMRPALAEEPEDYNWLFLFLGQSLGMLTLKDLKWFCKYTYSHRTGAKDRVLYASFMAIGNQLDPLSEVFIRPA